MPMLPHTIAKIAIPIEYLNTSLPTQKVKRCRSWQIQLQGRRYHPLQFRARLNDYYKSGFDRGHMVPAADVKNSQLKMDETSYLTNIVPQAGDGFNRDYWAHVETFCQSTTFMSLWDLCICLTRDPTANHHDGIEWHLHFISLCLPNQPISDNTPLEAFKVPVDAVERGSGLIFFERMGPAKENVPDLRKATKCPNSIKPSRTPPSPLR
ncbi:unnamed protein product [Absidia cylindrospora]